MSIDRRIVQEKEQDEINRSVRRISVQTPDGIFSSITEAAEHYNVSKTTIANWCRDKDKPDFFKIQHEDKRMPITSEMTVPAKVLDRMMEFLEQGDLRRARSVLSDFVQDNQKTEQVHAPEKKPPKPIADITFMMAVEIARHLYDACWFILKDGQLLMKGTKLPQPYHNELIAHRAEVMPFLLAPKVINAFTVEKDDTDKQIADKFTTWIDDEVHKGLAEGRYHQKDMHGARKVAWEKAMHHWHLSFGKRYPPDICAGCHQPITEEDDYMLMYDDNCLHQKKECMHAYVRQWIPAAEAGLKNLIGSAHARTKMVAIRGGTVIGPKGRTYKNVHEAADAYNKRLWDNYVRDNPGRGVNMYHLEGRVTPTILQKWCLDARNKDWWFEDEMPWPHDGPEERVMDMADFLADENNMLLDRDYSAEERGTKEKVNWGTCE